MSMRDRLLQRAEEALIQLLGEVRLVLDSPTDSPDPARLRVGVSRASACLSACRATGRRGLRELERNLRRACASPDPEALEELALDGITRLGRSRQRRSPGPSRKLNARRWRECIVELGEHTVLSTATGGTMPRQDVRQPAPRVRLLLEILLYAGDEGSDLRQLGGPAAIKSLVHRTRTWLRLHFAVDEQRLPIVCENGRYRALVRLVDPDRGSRYAR